MGRSAGRTVFRAHSCSCRLHTADEQVAGVRRSRPRHAGRGELHTRPQAAPEAAAMTDGTGRATRSSRAAAASAFDSRRERDCSLVEDRDGRSIDPREAGSYRDVQWEASATDSGRVHARLLVGSAGAVSIRHQSTRQSHSSGVQSDTAPTSSMHRTGCPLKS